MSEGKKPDYVEGMYVEECLKTDAEWMKYDIRVKVEELNTFLRKHMNSGGYVSLKIRHGKDSGKAYAVVNTYKMQREEAVKFGKQADTAFGRRSH